MIFFSWLTKAVDFFFDKSQSLSKRMTVATLGLAMILIVDNQIGFSYYYSISRKLSEVEKIQTLIKADTTNRPAKNYLKQLEYEVLNHKGFLALLWDFTSLTKSTVNNGNQIIKNSSSSLIGSRNLHYHFLSSSWAYIIILIFIPFAIFFDESIVFTTATFAKLLLVEGLIILPMLLLNYILLFIPVIDQQNLLYNYLLNAAVSFMSIISIAAAVGYTSSRRKAGEEHAQ